MFLKAYILPVQQLPQHDMRMISQITIFRFPSPFGFRVRTRRRESYRTRSITKQFSSPEARMLGSSSEVYCLRSLDSNTSLFGKYLVMIERGSQSRGNC